MKTPQMQFRSRRRMDIIDKSAQKNEPKNPANKAIPTGMNIPSNPGFSSKEMKMMPKTMASGHGKSENHQKLPSLNSLGFSLMPKISAGFLVFIFVSSICRKRK